MLKVEMGEDEQTGLDAELNRGDDAREVREDDDRDAGYAHSATVDVDTD